MAPTLFKYMGVGTKGLYDFGPPGAAVKANVLDLWKNHFVIEEDMLLLDSTCLTPYVVLKASGHVDKFADLMVQDDVTKEWDRCDKLVENALEVLIEKEKDAEKKAAMELDRNHADGATAEDLHEMITRYKILSTKGNALGQILPFNLMFKTVIGPAGNNLDAFLRPELAQSIFVNFRRLLEHNNNKMPFAGACIGQAFRNEIAPRSGVLRVREFTLAEIEHFCKHGESEHPKFEALAAGDGIVLNLFAREEQEKGDKIWTVTLREAHEKTQEGFATPFITNQTLAYYIGRTQAFLVKCGVRPDCIRFRQHLQTQMAHYADDCWDAEILTSYGWVECVGLADRSAFDLSLHTKHGNSEQVARISYDQPKHIEKEVVEPVMGLLGKAFRQKAKGVRETLINMSAEDIDCLKRMVEKDGEGEVELEGGEKVKIAKNMIKFATRKVKESGFNYVPKVIEPSFGVGRIVYALLEHCHYARPEDKDRIVMKFPPAIAPVKVAVLPLQGNSDGIKNVVLDLARRLRKHGVSNRIDDSGASIGRRYARQDEIGVPFGITVDFDTLTDSKATLRERDSTLQIRVELEKLPKLVAKLSLGRITWAEAQKIYPAFGTETKE